MPAKIYVDKDADLDQLQGKTAAVIGFGSQGHAHALNLKDSGVNVIIGLYPGSKSRAVAKEQGFEVYDTAEAVQKADVIFVAVPDTKIPAVFNADIAPHLTKGKTLLFSHGFAVHFKTIEVPADVDVILVAPKGPGHIVRRQFTEGKGVPSLIAVYQNPSKKARKIALAWAKGIGGTRAGVIETTFQEETETDLFGEQAVLCGGASALVQAGFEVLVEAGYSPEMAYYECLHELKLIVDLMNEAGISGMRFSISETAKWGDVVIGPRIIDSSVKKRMQSVLKEIQTGKFAKTWVKEYESGYPKYNALLAEGEKHPIEKVGARLRATMPWIQKKNLKGAQAAYGVAQDAVWTKEPAKKAAKAPKAEKAPKAAKAPKAPEAAEAPKAEKAVKAAKAAGSAKKAKAAAAPKAAKSAKAPKAAKAPRKAKAAKSPAAAEASA